MPYILKILREKLQAGLKPTSSGELNYLITELIKEYMAEDSARYVTINDIVGALECAKLEFYRRVAVPYEDVKIKENGDVYE